MKDNLDCTGHDLRTTNVLSGLKMCCLNINSLVKHFDEPDEELKIETIMTLFGKIETDTEVE